MPSFINLQVQTKENGFYWKFRKKLEGLLF